MSGGKAKKPTLAQKFAERRAALLARIDEVLASPGPEEKSVADDYLALKDLDKETAALAADIGAAARKTADEKRFWTAFGINTPLVAGILVVEPFTGTLALLASVVTGYTPTVVIKRILDDVKMGDAKELKSIALDLETLQIARGRLHERCRTIEQKQAPAIAAAPVQHELFRRYPELRARFLEKTMQAPRHPQPAAKVQPASGNRRRFGL